MEGEGIESPPLLPASIKRPAESTTRAQPLLSPEAERSTKPPLLIFGQGPVIDSATREKASGTNTKPGEEDVNFWSKNLAEAAAILYKKGATRQIIVMGGKTGGDQYSSEAQLIAKHLLQLGIPQADIKLENQSTNTLENIVFMLNRYFDSPESFSKEQKANILAVHYHVLRVKILMELFGIPVQDAFSSDEVLRFAARDQEFWNNAQLQEIERRLNINNADYYQNKMGTEAKPILRRHQEDDAFIRALLEVPEYWIPYLGKIQNPSRLHTILQNVHTLFPDYLTSLGIDITNIQDESGTIKEEVQSKLSQVKRIVPNIEIWIQEYQNKRLSEETEQQKLQGIVDRINNRK